MLHSYETTDAQTKKNRNRDTALERSVGKPLGVGRRGGGGWVRGREITGA